VRSGAQGIAFALNADPVQQVLSQHLSAARLAKPNHGLSVKEVVEGESRERQNVVEKAAAELRSGDVLVSVDERAVFNRYDLERSLWDHEAGDVAPARVVRDGKVTKAALKRSDVRP
jgi:S1-C subfamily serine protease